MLPDEPPRERLPAAHALARRAPLAYMRGQSERHGMDEIRGRLTRDGIRIHEDADFAGMHKAGRLAAEILDRIGEHVDVGVSTGHLDALVTRWVEEAGARVALAAVESKHRRLLSGRDRREGRRARAAASAGGSVYPSGLRSRLRTRRSARTDVHAL